MTILSAEFLPPNVDPIATALEWSSVVRDRALHREATEGTNREGHEDLAGWRILGGGRLNRKARRGEMVVLIGGPFLVSQRA